MTDLLSRLQKNILSLRLFIIRIKVQVLLHSLLCGLKLPQILIGHHLIEFQRLHHRIALYRQTRLKRIQRRLIISHLQLAQSQLVIDVRIPSGTDL